MTLKKWKEKENSSSGRNDNCDLIFHNCANITPAALKEACGDLLNKATMAEIGLTNLYDGPKFVKFFTKNCSLLIRFYI